MSWTGLAGNDVEMGSLGRCVDCAAECVTRCCRDLTGETHALAAMQTGGWSVAGSTRWSGQVQVRYCSLGGESASGGKGSGSASPRNGGEGAASLNNIQHV